MKDLYFNLGIDRNASADEVATALSLKPEMSVYAPILLDKEKRAVYDRTHAALSTIGVLRHGLGLGSGNSWFLENYPDFAPRLRSAVSSNGLGQANTEASGPEETQEIRQHRGMGSKPPARSKWLVPVVSGLVVIILLTLIFIFF